MTLTLHPKPTLDAFIRTCTPLAIIEPLEAEFEQRINAIADAMLQYEGRNDPVENLIRFLKADRDFLGIVLALTNLSQEKFLRILSAERFANGDYGTEWGIDAIHRKFRSDAGFAERIARLFIEGRENSLLAEQVAGFYLNQLSLPQDWNSLIHDHQLIQTSIRRKLAGEYNVKKGAAIETLIRDQLDRIQEKYGVSHTKGQVVLVRKEVDHVLPSVEQPYVMIMTSYMETTSSSQTARANEQSEMSSSVRQDNIRYGGDSRVFVNFVDGAGWLARRSDLRKIHAASDYIINLKTLDQLEPIVCKYVPKRFFTKQPRPPVEGSINA